MAEEELKLNKAFRVWLLFFLVLVIGSPLMEGGETYHTVIWLRLWVIVFALYYFRRRVGDKGIELAIPYGNWLVILLWLVLSVSLFITHYYYITVYWYSNILVYLVLFYLILNLLEGNNFERDILLAIFFIFILVAVIESVLGIADYLLYKTERASGTFFNPAYYTGYLLGLVSFPLSGLVFELMPEFSRKRRFLLKAIFFMCLVLIAGGMLVSASRAIVFSLVPIGLILVFRYRLKAIIVMILLVLAVVIFPNPFRSRIKNLGADPYAWDRITIWRTSLRMIREHPMGIGLGMYQYYYDRYAYPVRIAKIGRYAKTANWAHNEFINLAVECSVVSVVLVLAFVFLLFKPFVKRLFRGRGDFFKNNQALVLGFAGSFLGIVSHSLVDSNLHQPPIMILAVIDLGCLFYLMNNFQRGLVRRNFYAVMHPRFVRGFVLIAGMMIGMVMSYQAGIFGAVYRTSRVREPGIRLKRLVQLSRYPSGYAHLYFMIALDLRDMFFRTDNVDYAIQSIPYFEFATRVNPENYEYFYHWADTVYRLGIYLKNDKILTKAEEIANSSLKRSSHYVFTYTMLANIAHYKGDYGAEEKWLKMALETEPYYFMIRGFLIDLLIKTGRFEEARVQLNLLKTQKEEVDRIPFSQLNDFQRILVKISDSDIEELEKRLIERSR